MDIDNDESEGEDSYLAVWLMFNSSTNLLFQNLDQALDGLQSLLSSILNSSEDFAEVVVPKPYSEKKLVLQFTAFNKWMLGRFYCILTVKNLSGIHKDSVSAQIKILDILNAFAAEFYVEIINEYAYSLKELVAHFDKYQKDEDYCSLVMERFVPDKIDIPIKELDLCKVLIKVPNRESCRDLIKYTMEIINHLLVFSPEIHLTLVKNSVQDVLHIFKDFDIDLKIAAIKFFTDILSRLGFTGYVRQFFYFFELLNFLLHNIHSLNKMNLGQTVHSKNLILQMHNLLSKLCHWVPKAIKHHKVVIINICKFVLNTPDDPNCQENKTTDNVIRELKPICAVLFDEFIHHVGSNSIELLTSEQYISLLPSYFCVNLKLEVKEYLSRHSGADKTVCISEMSLTCSKLIKNACISMETASERNLDTIIITENLKKCLNVLVVLQNFKVKYGNAEQGNGHLLELTSKDSVTDSYVLDIMSRNFFMADSLNVFMKSFAKVIFQNPKIIKEQTDVIGNILIRIFSITREMDATVIQEVINILGVLLETSPGSSSTTVDTSSHLNKHKCMEILILQNIFVDNIDIKNKWDSAIADVMKNFNLEDVTIQVKILLLSPLLLINKTISSNELISNFLHPALCSGQSEVLKILVKVLPTILCILDGHYVLLETTTRTKNIPFIQRFYLEDVIFLKFFCFHCTKVRLSEKEKWEIEEELVDPETVVIPNRSRLTKTTSSERLRPVLEKFLDISRYENIEYLYVSKLIVTFSQHNIIVLPTINYLFDGDSLEYFNKILREFIISMQANSDLKESEKADIMNAIIQFLFTTTKQSLETDDFNKQQMCLDSIEIFGVTNSEIVLLPSIKMLIYFMMYPNCPFGPMASDIVSSICVAHGSTPTVIYHEYKNIFCRIMMELVAFNYLIEFDFVTSTAQVISAFEFESCRDFLCYEKHYILPYLIPTIVTNSNLHAIMVEIAAEFPCEPEELIEKRFPYIYTHILLYETPEISDKCFAYIETVTKTSLINLIKKHFRIILTEILLQYCIHADKVLAACRMLASYDPEYPLINFETSLSIPQLAEFLQPRFLGVLVYINSKLANVKVALAVKKMALRSLPDILNLMGPKHITPLRYKLLATLNTSLSLMKEYHGLNTLAWSAFIHNVDVVALGPLLPAIFVALMPILPHNTPQINEMFKFLVLSNENLLCDFIPDLFFLEDIDINPKVKSVVLKHVRRAKPKGFIDQVKWYLKYLNQDMLEIRVYTLRFLTELVHHHQADVHEAIFGSRDINPYIVILTDYLIAGSRDKDVILSSWSGRCLGEMGALQPSILPRSIKQSHNDKFTFSISDLGFAKEALKELTRALQFEKNTKSMNCYALAIQEILRTFNISPDGENSGLWESFPENMHQIMQPLLSSRYTLVSAVPQEVSYPIYGSNQVLTFGEWAYSWSSKLISLTSGPILDVLKTALPCLKGDVRTLVLFLPYIVLHAVTSPDADVEVITKEIMAVVGIDDESIQKINGKSSVQNIKITHPPPEPMDSIPSCSGDAPSSRLTRISEAISKIWNVSNLLKEVEADQENELQADPETTAQLAAEFKAFEAKEAQGIREASAEELPEEDMKVKCSKMIYILLDFLNRWLLEWSHSLKDSQCSNYLKLSSFLNGFCKLTISRGNFLCGEYERALQYLEGFMLQQPHHLQEQLGFLARIYADLDEPDAVAGIMKVKQAEPDISELLLAHEVTGQLQDAAICYEKCAQDGNIDGERLKGMIKVYLELDQPYMALNLLQGSDEVCGLAAEPFWRLALFPQLEKLLQLENLSDDDSWGVSMGRCLVQLRGGGGPPLEEVLEDARSSLLRHLVGGAGGTAEGRRAYQHSYEHVIGLHMLTELQHVENAVKKIQGLTDSSEECSETLDSLMEHWDLRLRLLQSSARTVEPVLRVRRILLQQFKELVHNSHPSTVSLLDAHIGKIWLQSAKFARKASIYHQALIYILNGEKHCPKEAFLEKAKVYWMKGDQDSAFQTLQRGLLKHFPKVTELSDADKKLCAKGKLLKAIYNDETTNVDMDVNIGHYKEAVEVYRGWEKSLVCLASYYERVYLAMAAKEKFGAPGGMAQVRALDCYGRALQHGHKHIYQSMPRMLSIWLDFDAQFPESKAPAMGCLQQMCTIIETFSERLPLYLFLTAFSQIVSRICHPVKEVYAQLKSIIVKLIIAYPQHSLWMMICVIKSSYPQRIKRCQEIFSDPRLKEPGLLKFTLDFNKLADKLIELCNKPVPDKVQTTRVSTLVKSLPLLLAGEKFSQIMIPHEHFVKIMLPTDSIQKERDPHYSPFPSLVYITGIEEEVTIFPSLQKPRKVTLKGSDGKKYIIMLKPKDDLRKDFRLMEFNGVVNRYLRCNPEARARRLHIRTYSVLPLNEECGLIEWVPHLLGFRPILMQLYKEKNLYTSPRELKALMCSNEDSLAKKRKIFMEHLLPKHPPIFGHWFRYTFPDPHAWYQARSAYIRTTAVMSMVGYILGLGDRHGENILFDCTNGDTVHVDFNCLFNKGECLDWPERVPFRLTHNMDNAMGPLKHEGMYRKCCEVTIRVLRSQTPTLMSVIRPFVYDPLVVWQRKQGQDKTSAERTNQSAKEHLLQIEQRLQGVVRIDGKQFSLPLSPEGQVNNLILEATSITNLCQMYIGWGPFL